MTTIKENLIAVKKRFSKIITYEPKHLHMLERAWIVIREKIDGSNIQIQRKGNELIVASREYFLNKEYTLNKAYETVQSLDVDKFEEGYIYFAEWITPFRLNYKNDFFTLRLLAIAKDDGSVNLNYVTSIEFERLHKKTGLLLAPLFYEGPFISLEHLKSFIGKTEMVQPIADEPIENVLGEGIVVMAYDMNTKEILKYKTGKNAIYKLVNQSYKERKLIPKTEKNDVSLLTHFLSEVTTEARIKKKYLDKVVEGVYPLCITKKDISIIMESLPIIIRADIEEEHCEELNEILTKLIMKEKEFIKENINKEKAESVDKKYDKLISKFVTNKVLKFALEEIGKRSV